MTETQEKAAALQERIFVEDYYTYLWCETLNSMNLRATKVDNGEYEDKVLALLCHRFWEALPDTSTIRRGPFFALTDLAEQVLDFDYGDEKHE